MKSDRIKKHAKAVIIIAVVFVLGYLSKPDRGGLSRCSRVFAISEIQDYELIHKPFFKWKLFESAKFRFTITAEAYERLAKDLKRLGYSEWKRGGITFGSVDVGCNQSEDNIYCKLTRNGYHHYWSYSAKKNLIYAVTFPT